MSAKEAGKRNPGDDDMSAEHDVFGKNPTDWNSTVWAYDADSANIKPAVEPDWEEAERTS